MEKSDIKAKLKGNRKRKIDDFAETVRKIKSENAVDASECDADDMCSNKKIKSENNSVAKKKVSKTKEHVECKIEDMPGVSWDVASVISSKVEVPKWAAQNVVKLLDEGCTIPFIARYRKEQTGDMEVPKLRDTCNLLEELRTVETKVKKVKAEVKGQGKLTKELDQAFSSAMTITEVECLYAPFKPGQKGSLAERARAVGLEPLAQQFVAGNATPDDVKNYVNINKKGLETAEKVHEGVRHIIADMIHKDTVIMEKIRSLSASPHISIYSKKAKESQAKNKPGTKTEAAYKFERYFDKTFSAQKIQAHQMLAINRGESNKILTVKVVVPDLLTRELQCMCRARWMKENMPHFCSQMIEKSVQDSYSRMMEPQICRLVRSQLTKQSEKSSIEVFARNLKCLLLTSPLKGNTILAIDPGFKNGCKTAVISKIGEVLATCIVYLHSTNNIAVEKKKLSQLITKCGCDVIAVGNGQACRETETVVAKLIQESFPRLKYCIVSECGASIYSVSDAAQAEMPDLDPSLRGAVSIGRRLLDPLAEFVKVDPKHLGIGQYQHDMPQSQLNASLDSIIEECVSFVGVDLNTCSHCLLSHVSGMSAAKAKKVIEFRNQFGAFICREQLKSVKGLGEKTYEQVAGFIRIHTESNNLPSTEVDEKTEEKQKDSKAKRKTAKKKLIEFETNPLDMTWIHPESYETTRRLMEKIQVRINNIGQPTFIEKVKKYLARNTLKEIAKTLGCGKPTIKLITDALVRPLSYDFRDEFEKPLFRNSVKSLEDLRRGDTVTGRVMNVTNFGAFIDIGVGVNALIHVSKMCFKQQKYELKLGEKVEGMIDKLEPDKQRISLRLLRVL